MARTPNTVQRALSQSSRGAKQWAGAVELDMMGARRGARRLRRETWVALWKPQGGPISHHHPSMTSAVDSQEPTACLHKSSLSVSLSTNQVRTTTADVRDVFLSRSLFFIAARALCHASNGHASKDDNWRLTLSHARFLFFFLSLLLISLARLFKRCRPSLLSPPSSWASGR
jgi:hypothetical protein